MPYGITLLTATRYWWTRPT